MKNLIVLAALVIGVSAQAENHGHKKADKAAAAAPAGTPVAMTEKDATAACKKEGKTGEALTTCVKEKTATH